MPHLLLSEDNNNDKKGEVQNPAGNCGRKRIWDFIPWLRQHGRRGAPRQIRSLNPLAEEKDPIFNAQLVARKYKGIDVVGKKN